MRAMHSCNSWLALVFSFVFSEFNFEQFVKLVSAETRLHSFERRKSDLREAFAVFDCHNTGIFTCLPTQRVHDVEKTSYRRRCESFLRNVPAGKAKKRSNWLIKK